MTRCAAAHPLERVGQRRLASRPRASSRLLRLAGDGCQRQQQVLGGDEACRRARCARSVRARARVQRVPMPAARTPTRRPRWAERPTAASALGAARRGRRRRRSGAARQRCPRARRAARAAGGPARPAGLPPATARAERPSQRLGASSWCSSMTSSLLLRRRQCTTVRLLERMAPDARSMCGLRNDDLGTCWRAASRTQLARSRWRGNRCAPLDVGLELVDLTLQRGDVVARARGCA